MPAKKRTEASDQVDEIEVVLLGIEPRVLRRFALLGVVRESGTTDEQHGRGPQEEQLKTTDGRTGSSPFGNVLGTAANAATSHAASPGRPPPAEPVPL